MGFFNKDVNVKCAALAEKGNSPRLIKLAAGSKKYDERIAAFKALGSMRGEELTIKCCMDALKEDDEGIRAAAAAALFDIGTKQQVDQLMHYSQSESNEEIAKALKEAAVKSKERTPRW